MNAVEIPPELVTPLRGALITEMGGLAEDLGRACIAYEKVKSRGRFLAVFAEIDACREMIDQIGWQEPEDLSQEEPGALDLTQQRRRLVVKALRNNVVSEREFVTEHADTEGYEYRCERARLNIRAIEAFLADHDPSEN